MKAKTGSKLAAAVLVIVVLAIAASFAIKFVLGNKTLFDTTYKFTYAQIAMPDGTIVEGPVTDWNDYNDSDMFQITIDGEVYLTHSANAVLIAEK